MSRDNGKDSRCRVALGHEAGEKRERGRVIALFDARFPCWNYIKFICGGGGGWNNLCGPRIRFRVIRGGGEGFGRNFQPPPPPPLAGRIRRTNLQANPLLSLRLASDAFVVANVYRIKYTSKPDRWTEKRGTARETSRHDYYPRINPLPGYYWSRRWSRRRTDTRVD